MIILIDFGSQTTHLIARRIRELGVMVKIVNTDEAMRVIADRGVDGIIFSGGPASVYAKDAPTVNKEIFKLGIPILGICYGLQLIAHLLGGKVKAGNIREFGPAELHIFKNSVLLENIPKSIIVWMSHGDEVVRVPKGFFSVATTSTIPNPVMSNVQNQVYGIQFHPEVVHTQFGTQVLENFLKICGLTPKRKALDKEFVDNLIKDIKDSLGEEKAICALSGGVDSSVASLLVHQAIGQNLFCVYIDSGLMREGETETLQKVFKDHYKMNVDIADAKDKFLNALKGISDPEEKRKIIGKVFIEVFEKEAKKYGAKFLVQGTIYPDVIESAGTRHSQKIKSHHNVGGLPEKMNLSLIEPVRNFYKDEVRIIGKILGLPEQILNRQPFPGPGLAVRIIGDVTQEKLNILRRSDKIVQDEVNKFFLTEKEKAGFGKTLWQVFAVFTGIKTTGVRGDERVYGQTIAIRAIEAQDAMSANFAKLPYELLEKISLRIVTEVPEVNRVVYDITNKPPATMEWE